MLISVYIMAITLYYTLLLLDIQYYYRRRLEFITIYYYNVMTYCDVYYMPRFSRLVSLSRFIYTIIYYILRSRRSLQISYPHSFT